MFALVIPFPTILSCHDLAWLILEEIGLIIRNFVIQLLRA